MHRLFIKYFVFVLKETVRMKKLLIFWYCDSILHYWFLSISVLGSRRGYSLACTPDIHKEMRINHHEI